MALTLSLGTSELLGTYLITPLGTKNFLILQNLTEWPLFMQQKHVTIDCFNFSIDCFSGTVEKDVEIPLFLIYGLNPKPDFLKTH